MAGDLLRERFCHIVKIDGFHDQRPLDKAPWPSQKPGVCADAQCCKITWLEELASERNTIQAQEYISASGEIAGKYTAKLYMKMRWLFINISGCMYSFGTASFVVLDIISGHPWIAAGTSRKSI